MTFDCFTIFELYKKRDKMLHEIGLLLEDSHTLHEIGNKTFIEFESELLKPMIEMFSFQKRSPSEVWKYRGHKLSLIKYYCDTFNTRNDDD